MYKTYPIFKFNFLIFIMLNKPKVNNIAVWDDGVLRGNSCVPYSC